MKYIDVYIRNLEETPRLLHELLDQVPSEMLKAQRVPGKWSIHEHACHIMEAEKMIFRRFQCMKEDVHPRFNSYVPGKTVDDIGLIEMDLTLSIERFLKLRNSMVNLIEKFTLQDWEKRFVHEEYTEYNAYILLRHVLLHDHFHMYRIEELWLTRVGFLPNEEINI